MRFPALPASTRKAIYAVAVAAVGLLVGYRLLAAEQAPLWLALVGSLLISVVSWLLSSLISDRGRVEVIELRRGRGEHWS